MGDTSTAVIELRAHGPWSSFFGEQVTARLRLCLAGPSTVIIVDLRHLDDPHAASLPFWLAAWRQARLAPAPARVVFCLSPATALSRRLRNRQGPQPRVCATLAEARVAITERAARADRFQVRLAPLPASARAARDLVAQACHAWNLARLEPDSALIMSELAANAVEHAGTDFTATVTHAGTGLHLAVRDNAARFPHSSELTLGGPQLPPLERGRGLRLIHAIAAGWGATPTRGGKVVWASVDRSPAGRATGRGGA
ncbi:ATP-binding protein [Actinoplanes sp. TRM 88003]|uniref:ATP-binding protein n=1 Tax=Paractinoplanes aksuensis TaxID=2939490 RepID=A0ABT1DND8_9ACTN|nr:ATP-binding protein [Actinoplanes aksuensis]MCO8271555.1 ATP-binding protein [Actinoplanes aksuensis]